VHADRFVEAVFEPVADEVVDDAFEQDGLDKDSLRDALLKLNQQPVLVAVAELGVRVEHAVEHSHQVGLLDLLVDFALAVFEFEALPEVVYQLEGFLDFGFDVRDLLAEQRDLGAEVELLELVELADGADQGVLEVVYHAHHLLVHVVDFVAHLHDLQFALVDRNRDHHQHAAEQALLGCGLRRVEEVEPVGGGVDQHVYVQQQEHVHQDPGRALLRQNEDLTEDHHHGVEHRLHKRVRLSLRVGQLLPKRLELNLHDRTHDGSNQQEVLGGQHQLQVVGIPLLEQLDADVKDGQQQQRYLDWSVVVLEESVQEGHPLGGRVHHPLQSPQQNLKCRHKKPPIQFVFNPNVLELLWL